MIEHPTRDELIAFGIMLYVAGAALTFGRLAAEERRDDHLHALTMLVWGVIALTCWWFVAPVMFVHDHRPMRKPR